MRGADAGSGSLFSYVDLESRIPAKHPLHGMRDLVNAPLSSMDGAFKAPYSLEGRPSISPEHLLRAALLQLLYTIRSGRQLVGRLRDDLLFRWFVGLGIDDAVFGPPAFSKNRSRLLTAGIAQAFLSALLAHPKVSKLLSAGHFPVDGTMLKAFASIKSFRAKDGSDQPPGPGRNDERDFKQEKRSNETHASTAGPDARLYRKGNGQESKLACLGHALMENRNGLTAAGTVTLAASTAGRDAATAMTIYRKVRRWARTRTRIPKRSLKTSRPARSRRT